MATRGRHRDDDSDDDDRDDSREARSVLCIPGPLAVLTGILAIREMRRDPKPHGMGRAVFGIVMGAFGTVGLIIMAIALATGR